MDKMDFLQTHDVINYLQQDLRFGLFEVGSSFGGRYYFENGKAVKSDVLWEAIRVVNNLTPHHGKTLKQLCPNYIGEYKYKAAAHNWKKNRERILLKFFL